MARIYWKVQQGTREWFKLRSGIPTASEFHHIITPKKMVIADGRWKYACRLVAERLLNWQAESLDTLKHIEEGKASEPLAVAQLHILSGIETHRVGFVTTADGRFGASPDRAKGGKPDTASPFEDGSLDLTCEVKCPTPIRQFEYLLLPWDDAYRCQVQGQLHVCEADKAIFYSFNPRMPACHVESGRDETFIRKLHGCLEQFSDELEDLTEKAQALGAYEAYAEIVTPAEAELGDGLRRDPLVSEEELAALIEQEMKPGEHHRAEA